MKKANIVVFVLILAVAALGTYFEVIKPRMDSEKTGELKNVVSSFPDFVQGEPLSTVSVASGSAIEDFKDQFPGIINAVVDGTQTTLPGDWDYTPYDANEPGTYDFTLILPDGYTFVPAKTDDRLPYVEVIVKSKDAGVITPVIENPEVSVPDSLPGLTISQDEAAVTSIPEVPSATDSYPSVQDASKSSTGSSSTGSIPEVPSASSASIPASTASSYVFLGDSRIDGMSSLKSGSGVQFVSNDSASAEWYQGEGLAEAESKCTGNSVLFIMPGVLDLSNPSAYAAAANKAASDLKAYGVKVYLVSACPVEPNETVTNSDIETFNASARALLDGETGYIDAYEQLMSKGYKTGDDGILYDADTLDKEYKFITSFGG